MTNNENSFYKEMVADHILRCETDAKYLERLLGHYEEQIKTLKTQKDRFEQQIINLKDIKND